MKRRELGRNRTRLDAATAAVIADAVIDDRVVDVVVGDRVVDADVVDNHRAVVHVVNVGDVDVADGAIVGEAIAVPVAALIAGAVIAEAIGHAAVEADVATPVAAMEAIAAVVRTPPSRRPERANIGRGAPGAGHPEVACRRVAPVAGSPQIVVLRRLRLVIDGQRRGRFGRLLAGIDIGVDGIAQRLRIVRSVLPIVILAVVVIAVVLLRVTVLRVVLGLLALDRRGRLLAVALRRLLAFVDGSLGRGRVRSRLVAGRASCGARCCIALRGCIACTGGRGREPDAGGRGLRITGINRGHVGLGRVRPCITHRRHLRLVALAAHHAETHGSQQQGCRSGPRDHGALCGSPHCLDPRVAHGVHPPPSPVRLASAIQIGLSFFNPETFN